ncbi:MAG: GDSL-type esterase/lipase family protein [Polyangiaceae bacterium]
MRAPLLAGLLVLAIGCGEGAAVKGAETVSAPHMARPTTLGFAAASTSTAASTSIPNPTPTSTPTSTSTSTPASSPRIGHLEGWANLSHLFASLALVEAGRAHDDVRVVQFGDSHTAADVGTAVFRHLLQDRFGDGGRGFVSIGRPWKSYYAELSRGGMAGDFEAVRNNFKDGRYQGDGRYGLLGVGVRAAQSGSRAWAEVRTPFTHAEIAYLEQPQGGSFDVFVDGAKVGRVATRAKTVGSAFYPIDASDAPHQVELHTVGEGEVRILGMTLDLPRAGVVVDELGVNGAQIASLLRANEDHFVEQLRHRAPDLVVLAYGTNEALDPDLSDSDYERKMVDELARVERAAPDASCLLLGPPDLARRGDKGTSGPWKTWPRVPEIVAAQRRVAAAAKCAFYDQLEAMGGPGSMMTWVNEPDSRASSDHVHMRRNGYTQLGTQLATDLMRAYDEWRATTGRDPSNRSARGLPPAGSPATWTVGLR